MKRTRIIACLLALAIMLCLCSCAVIETMRDVAADIVRNEDLEQDSPTPSKPVPDDDPGKVECDLHLDNDFNGVCDTCGKKNLYGDIVDDDPTEEPDEPNDPTEKPDDPNPPVNIYLDPDNIYADINRLQLLQTPTEPTGFKGDYLVTIGKSGYLYEKAYMDEYLGVTGTVYTQVEDKGLRETVEKLEYIQKELEKRGIAMLLVITPSKAGEYADYIPEHYKNTVTTKPGYVRPIDRLRPMLEASDVNYLDSSKYYEEIGLLVTFPKTGTHWNALAAFESTKGLLDMYRDLTGKQTVNLSTAGVLFYDYPQSSFANEQDLFNILYSRVDPKYKEEAIRDDAYYSPEIKVENKSAPKLNVLMQGGSFEFSITHYIQFYGVGNVTQLYYNNFDSNSPWTDGPEAWEYWLKDRDVVIFEANEQQIRGGHWTPGTSWVDAANNGHIGHNAIYDSLYEYLKAHEGEYTNKPEDPEDDFVSINPPETVYVTINDINLRVEPSKNGSVVARLSFGAKLERIGTNADGWSKVLYNGNCYYMSSDYLTTQDVTGESFVVLEEPVNKTVTASTLKVRSSPFMDSMDENVVGYLSKGDVVKCVALSPDGQWYRIEMSGGTYYVGALYLSGYNPGNNPGRTFTTLAEPLLLYTIERIGGVRVYAVPNILTAEVMTVEGGIAVRCVAISTDEIWCRVVFADNPDKYYYVQSVDLQSTGK